MRIVGLQEDTLAVIKGKAEVAPVGAPEAPPIAPGAPQAPSLDGLSVAKLKDYADTHGISLGEATKKDDILAVIKGKAEV